MNDEDACPVRLRSPAFEETALDGTALAGGADGTSGATFAACRDEGLCKLRNELCAGYLLAEAARSPVQRVLGGDRSMTPFELDESMLAIPQVERASLPRDVASTKRVRLQPLTGPGRAAALRGATHRFQEAARIAHYFHTWDTGDGHTCLDRFLDADLSGKQPPQVPAHEDGTPVTWSDLFYQGFLEAT